MLTHSKPPTSSSVEKKPPPTHHRNYAPPRKAEPFSLRAPPHSALLRERHRQGQGEDQSGPSPETLPPHHQEIRIPNHWPTHVARAPRARESVRAVPPGSLPGPLPDPAAARARSGAREDGAHQQGSAARNRHDEKERQQI